MEENKMKNIFKILAGTAFMTALAACSLNETPVFDDKDAFVAMDRTSIIVNEDAGTVSIPVTIASVNPMKTSVTYEVVDGSAKKGTDYTLADESAVLLFDGQTRTMNIVINIIEHTGENGYTGDLTFTVNILNAGSSLNLGANSSCSVKISDLDHPLQAILGEYEAIGYNYFNKAEESWTLTMYKDDNDINVVWVDGIIQGLAGNYPSYDFRVYGNVSEDKQTISFPCGQALKDAVNGTVVTLWSFNGSTVSSSGAIEAKLEDGTWTIEAGLGIGYTTEDDRVSLFGLYNPGTVRWTKK